MHKKSRPWPLRPEKTLKRALLFFGILFAMWGTNSHAQMGGYIPNLIHDGISGLFSLSTIVWTAVADTCVVGIEANEALNEAIPILENELEGDMYFQPWRQIDDGVHLPTWTYRQVVRDPQTGAYGIIPDLPEFMPAGVSNFARDGFRIVILPIVQPQGGAQ